MIKTADRVERDGINKLHRRRRRRRYPEHLRDMKPLKRCEKLFVAGLRLKIPSAFVFFARLLAIPFVIAFESDADVKWNRPASLRGKKEQGRERKYRIAVCHRILCAFANVTLHPRHGHSWQTRVRKIRRARGVVYV